MTKAPEAFRTISEVSEWLNTPNHVLRFWERDIPEISPLRRAGGRRYYRPEDMLLLGGIKRLLHVENNTIKAVKAMIADKGVAYIAGLSPKLDQPFEAQVDMPEADIEAELAQIKIPEDPASDPNQPVLKTSGKDVAPDRVAKPSRQWLASGPSVVRPLAQYSVAQMGEIETLFYALKMTRNKMRRAVKRRARIDATAG